MVLHVSLEAPELQKLQITIIASLKAKWTLRVLAISVRRGWDGIINNGSDKIYGIYR